MKVQKLIPVLDNGHGEDTPGKRSPVWPNGKQLFEWEFNRDIVSRIYKGLTALGIESIILVPEHKDIPLSERVKRANTLHLQKGKKTFLVSVHANAGGGTGWEVFTSPGQTKSDEYATIFFEEARKEFATWRMRTDSSDGDPDKESAFYILTKTNAPAVLTENFFMDTSSDCELLLSEDGRQRIANAHIAAIVRIVAA